MKKSRALFGMMESQVTSKVRSGFIAGIALCLLAIVGSVVAQKEKARNSEDTWTTAFAVEEFSSTGINPYFILKPGYTLILEGTEDGKKKQLTVAVLNETKS